MKYSRTVTDAEMRAATTAKNVVEALHHQLVTAIAREHMDHGISVRIVDNEDGTHTLTVEY